MTKLLGSLALAAMTFAVAPQAVLAEEKVRNRGIFCRGVLGNAQYGQCRVLRGNAPRGRDRGTRRRFLHSWRSGLFAPEDRRRRAVSRVSHTDSSGWRHFD